MVHEKGRSVKGSVPYHIWGTRAERGPTISIAFLLETHMAFSAIATGKRVLSVLHSAMKFFGPEVTCHFHSQPIAWTNPTTLPNCNPPVYLERLMGKLSGSLQYLSQQGKVTCINEWEIEAMGQVSQMNTSYMPSPGVQLFFPCDTYMMQKRQAHESLIVIWRSTATGID